MADETLPLPPGATAIADTPPLPEGATAAPPLPPGAKPFGESTQPKGGVPAAPQNNWFTTPTSKKPGLLERGKKVAEEAGIGGAIGFFAPELTSMAGVAASAFPLTAPLGPPLLMTGSAMRGSRLAQVGIGALAGGGGEVGAQIAEAYGQPEKVQEIARLAGGVVTPEFGGLIRYAGSKLIGKGMGASVKEAASALADDLGLDYKALSPSQRSYIEKVAADIRGGNKSDDSLKAVYETLDEGSRAIVKKYSTSATDLEFQAERLNALAAKGGTDGQRVGTMATDLSAGAQRLVKEAQDSANAILRAAEDRAATIRSESKAKGTERVGMADIDAQDVLQRGKQRADQILQEANTRATRLREVADRARESAGKRVEGATADVSKVGAPQLPTQTGNKIREAVMPLFEKLKAIRSGNAEKLKGEAFDFAAMLESSGKFAKDTAAFRDALQYLDAEIKNTTLDVVRSPLTRIRDALERTTVNDEGMVIEKPPVTFSGLETIRRFLRDRSYGLPAEGFDAINQQQAGKLARLVEDIQREFSPSIENFLTKYAEDSKPLTDFKTKLGKSIVGVEDFDMGRFVTDPADIGAKFFRTESGVRDLITMLGGDVTAAEGIARGFVMDKLRSPNADSIKKFMDGPARDWLTQFPKLKTELESAAQKMGGAESVASKRTALSSSLRGKASSLFDNAPTAAGKVSGKAEDEAQRISRRGLREQSIAVAKGEREAGSTLSQGATKAGGELSGAAKKLSAEGEKIRVLIMGDSFPAERVKEVILSGSPELWSEVGPLIAQKPEAKKAFVDAVRQVVADKAAASPKGVVDAFNRNIRPALEQTGLMSKAELNSLQAKIDQINKTVDGPRKAGLIQRAITNALTAETAKAINAFTDPFGSMARLYRSYK